MELPVFQFVPIALSPVTGTMEESGSILLKAILKMFCMDW